MIRSGTCHSKLGCKINFKEKTAIDIDEYIRSLSEKLRSFDCKYNDPQSRTFNVSFQSVCLTKFKIAHF